jgi:hypothetical protein
MDITGPLDTDIGCSVRCFLLNNLDHENPFDFESLGSLEVMMTSCVISNWLVDTEQISIPHIEPVRQPFVAASVKTGESKAQIG